ncbi:fumarylacetoacetate hydrolase family protein [Pseudoflavitalea rhizosphaerae]|uniref:fumarylacetoacetate hydrolase family protein n=1 Tax=Pseudoflavitalea rhizosphaerae TaxID=1884793 RepID=UPI000F8D5399|nr:fumarylacetoacetate hydrolase family protein [Pseudoflavitalea rhizosphaerae]
MKILYFKKQNRLHPGILTEQGVFDADAYLQRNQQPTFNGSPLRNEDQATLRRLMVEAQGLPEFFLPLSSLQVASCIPNPGKIICIGLNYRKHAIESNMPIPESPVVFSKFSNTLTDFGEAVPLGNTGVQFDYEVELGVVIGAACKNVKRENALQYVFGYCVANDLSCRDLQFKTSQWLIGKTPDKFLPLGQYLVTADEIPDPQQLELTCSRNGVIRQRSNTRDMIFTVAEIIEELSRYMTLSPGDLILTGTPEGVIMGLPEKNWLKPGDRVRTEIEQLGYTENFMI